MCAQRGNILLSGPTQDHGPAFANLNPRAPGKTGSHWVCLVPYTWWLTSVTHIPLSEGNLGARYPSALGPHPRDKPCLPTQLPGQGQSVPRFQPLPIVRVESRRAASK